MQPKCTETYPLFSLIYAILYQCCIHPTYLSLYARILVAETVIVICWLLLFVCYSTALDSIDISTSDKGKTSISTNDVEVYSKEVLGDEIRRLIAANIQLITDKMEIEKTRVNLEANRIRLFSEKNSLVVKREEFRAEIVILNAVNIPIRGH